MPTPAHHIKQYNGATNLAVECPLLKMLFLNYNYLMETDLQRFGIQKFNAWYVSSGHLKMK